MSGVAIAFAYVSQNPASRLDPFGQDWLSALGSFGTGVVEGGAGAIVTSLAIASGTVAGAAVAVGTVGYGAYQMTIAAQRMALGVDPYTGQPIGAEQRWDIAPNLAGVALGGGLAGSRGNELSIGDGLRLAPFGNRGSGELMKELPHYHKRVLDPNNPGKTLDGQGIGRHRPWETNRLTRHGNVGCEWGGGVEIPDSRHLR